MSRTSTTIRAIGLAVAAAALAAACDKSSPPPPAATASGAAAPAEAPDLVPSHMVSAVSSSKTAALIGVHFALESRPTVGEPLGVEIALIPREPFTGLRALFETPDSVVLATGERLELGAVKANTVFRHKLVMQPSQEGVFLIMVAVESESDDGMVTRIYSIPVIVEGAKSQPAPATGTPASGG